MNQYHNEGTLHIIILHILVTRNLVYPLTFVPFYGIFIVSIFCCLASAVSSEFCRSPTYIRTCCFQSLRSAPSGCSPWLFVSSADIFLHPLTGKISGGNTSMIIQKGEKTYCYKSISPPYTFFLLNGDMELYRNKHFFI